MGVCGGGGVWVGKACGGESCHGCSVRPDGMRWSRGGEPLAPSRAL